MPDRRFMKNMFAMQKNRVDLGALDFVGDFAPVSGTSGTGVGVMSKGSTFLNTLTGVQYYNEGTADSPYWTPVGYEHQGLYCFGSNFRNGTSLALADLTQAYTLAEGGVRVFGNSVDANDAGVVIAHVLGASEASMHTGVVNGEVVALGAGGATVPFKPSTMGPLVIDALVSMTTAITLRRLFCGFLGTAADALATPFSGSGTTITNSQNDMAGLVMDAAFTAAARFYATRNKANGNPTLATTATGVDTTKDIPAAGTYVRLRVEVSAAGKVTCFIDKVQVSSVADALTPATALAPALVLGSTSGANKVMAVKHFYTWANRV